MNRRNFISLSSVAIPAMVTSPSLALTTPKIVINSQVRKIAAITSNPRLTLVSGKKISVPTFLLRSQIGWDREALVHDIEGSEDKCYESLLRHHNVLNPSPQPYFPVLVIREKARLLRTDGGYYIEQMMGMVLLRENCFGIIYPPVLKGDTQGEYAQ